MSINQNLINKPILLGMKVELQFVNIQIYVR